MNYTPFSSVDFSKVTVEPPVLGDGYQTLQIRYDGQRAKFELPYMTFSGIRTTTLDDGYKISSITAQVSDNTVIAFLDKLKETIAELASKHRGRNMQLRTGKLEPFYKKSEKGHDFLNVRVNKGRFYVPNKEKQAVVPLNHNKITQSDDCYYTLQIKPIIDVSFIYLNSEKMAVTTYFNQGIVKGIVKNVVTSAQQYDDFDEFEGNFEDFINYDEDEQTEVKSEAKTSKTKSRVVKKGVKKTTRSEVAKLMESDEE